VVTHTEQQNVLSRGRTGWMKITKEKTLRCTGLPEEVRSVAAEKPAYALDAEEPQRSR